MCEGVIVPFRYITLRRCVCSCSHRNVAVRNMRDRCGQVDVRVVRLRVVCRGFNAAIRPSVHTTNIVGLLHGGCICVEDWLVEPCAK